MTTDVLVIGGGIAGYTAAIRAAQRDLAVVLVEDGDLGGTCLNYGCIPSKALLSASKTAYEMETADTMGIYVEPYVDVAEMVEWKDGIVERLTDGVETLCRYNGIEIVEGRARFIDTTTAVVDDSREITFENAIIATGSRPRPVPGFNFAAGPILDARQALAVDRVPPRLLVVGAGYIGMELSTVFARLGTDVTVVELLDTVLPQFDDDLTQPVYEAARSLGIEFEFGVAATEWAQTDQGVVVTIESDDGEATEHAFDSVLVAVGRDPVTTDLQLDAIDVRTTDQGFIETDTNGQTAVDHIFAVGDVAGEPMLAHAGMHEAIVAAESIAGDPHDTPAAVPSVVFTDPEIATVGLTKADARQADGEFVVGQFPFSASGRAMTTRETEGFVRLIADGDGRIRGGEIVGPEASELIAEIALAVEAELTLDTLAGTVHPHPTLSEATMEAAEHARNQAIHTTNR